MSQAFRGIEPGARLSSYDHDAFGNASAIILAGGKSGHMGTPKFLLDCAGVVDPKGLSFINIDTPDEYQTALGRWQSRPVFNAANSALLR